MLALFVVADKILIVYVPSPPKVSTPQTGVANERFDPLSLIARYGAAVKFGALA
jgi:hypothetical protein